MYNSENVILAKSFSDIFSFIGLFLNEIFDSRFYYFNSEKDFVALRID